MPPYPVSPTTRRQTIPHGFRPSFRPKPKPIEEMTLRELQDRQNLNAKILDSPCVFLPVPIPLGTLS